MKKHVWFVIAVVLFFIGLIIVYTLAPPDRDATGVAATAAEKPH